ALTLDARECKRGTSTKSNSAWRKCSSCGTTLNESVPIPSGALTNSSLDDDSCPVCRLTRTALLRMPPPEDCPRCSSTRVLRTRAVNEVGEEMFLCPHCDHVWARPQSSSPRMQ